MDNVRVSLAEDCLTNISIHHPAFCLELDISNDNQAPCSSEIIFDFPRGNYNELNKYFNGIDWEVIVSSNSVDSAVQEFYSALYAGMELYIPTKRVETCPSTRPAWFTSRLLKLIMMKKAAHTTYKRTGMAKDYNIFSDIRRSCKDLNDQLHSDYIGNLEDSLVRNPKYFWTFMRNIRNDRGLPCEVSFGDVRLSSVTDIADAFAEHFQSAYVLPIACGVSVASANNVNSAEFREPLSNLDTVISLEEVFAALSGLRDSHSAGPDNLSSSFLKSCIFSLSSPIHKIFNRSLSEGKFPSIWKLSFIQPIHKSGKRDIVENYRGVCLQSVLPKLLDKLVADRLSRICRPLLSDKQHGFCKGRSTLSNLLEYSTFISESLEKGYQVDAVYTDFAKAFDRVSHSHLLNKLEGWGFPCSIISWFRSFLTERFQRVKLGHSVSKLISVFSGVPQGSHCGPLLFQIFIDDIVHCVSSSNCLLFADDLKLFRIINSREDYLSLQQDLHNIQAWCMRNSLFLNVEKCHVISFTKRKITMEFVYCINSIVVLRVDHISDLGVTFTSQFSFKEHIFAICNKARRRWGFIRRTCGFLNVHVLKILYISLVRSVLEYASPVWSPHYNCDVEYLERVQNHFLRHMEFKLGRIHVVGEYSSILMSLNLQPLDSRRVVSDLCFLYC